MAHGDSVEREVKLAAELQFSMPDFRPVVGSTRRLPEQTLRTAYFDTQDFRLWGRGITLRHREGEGSASGVWTLKLPHDASGSALERTELTWPGSGQQTPPEAAAMLQGVVRRAQLSEVVQLESHRKRLKLGASVGEIDDDVVTVKSGHRKGHIFRQIELELGGDGPPDEAAGRVIDGVLNLLRRAGAYDDQHQKFAKALGLSTPPSPGFAIGRGSTVDSAVELSIGNGLGRLQDHDVHLRLTPAAPAQRSVHQARVAARRLRSDLKTFRTLLDPMWLDHTTTELKWIGAILGRVRDIDVLRERLESAELDQDMEKVGCAELQALLDHERSRASRELGQALESDRYLELLERLAAAAALPPFRQPAQRAALAADVLPPLVRRQYKALRRRVRRGGRHPDDAELHKIRIGAKQLRYAAEAAAPFVGKSARRAGRRSERLQTVLGEHHDAVTAEQWLRAAAEEHGSVRGGFAAGRLVGQAREEKVDRAQEWRNVWRRVHHDRWLHQ